MHPEAHSTGEENEVVQSHSGAMHGDPGWVNSRAGWPIILVFLRLRGSQEHKTKFYRGDGLGPIGTGPGLQAYVLQPWEWARDTPGQVFNATSPGRPEDILAARRTPLGKLLPRLPAAIGLQGLGSGPAPRPIWEQKLVNTTQAAFFLVCVLTLFLNSNNR